MNGINNKKISSDRYTFWLDDISVFFKNYGYINFIPRSDMTRIEQLNALTLFCLYLIILLLIFDQTGLIFIPICGIILFIVLYNVFEVKSHEKPIKKNNILEKFQKQDIYLTSDSNIMITDQDMDIHREDDISTNYDHSIGYSDTNDKSEKYEKLSNDVTYRKPTDDNPNFIPTVDHINKNNIPVACNTDHADIEDNINSSIDNELNKNNDNVLLNDNINKNTQRQFFKIPHDILGDQEAFTKWCYKHQETI